MGLIVRFQGGARAGELCEFGDEVELVRFGRDPRRCEVVLSAGESGVSREHFALRRVLGRWRVVLNRESPLWVEGGLAHDDQVLEDLAEIVVGKDGPRLRIETTGESSLVTTQGAKLAQPGAHTLLERARASLRRHRWAAAAGFVVLGGLTGLVGFLAWEARASGVRLQLELLDATAAQREEVERAMRDYEARHPDQARIRAVLEEARPSVLAVLALRPEREPVPIGTAFAIEHGRAATNAHVAREALRQRAAGARVVLRASGRQPVDFTVADAVLHPGYEAFEALHAGYQPLDASTGDMLSLVPACDVAVLIAERPADVSATASNGAFAAASSTTSPTASNQAPTAMLAGWPRALPLVPRSDSASLGAGELVAAIGFPVEGLVSRGADFTRPVATAQIGNVTRVTDFFQGEAPAGDARLVHHDVPGVGGASGSPILDARGRVVALHCAASFSFVPRFDLASGGVLYDARGQAAIQRIPTGGYNFAQRVDVLHELLDGSSTWDEPVVIAAWRARFEELRERGHGWMRDHSSELFRARFAQHVATQGFTVRGASEIAERELAVASGSRELLVPIDGELPAGTFLATCVAHGPEVVELLVVLPDGRTIPGGGPLGACAVAFELAAPTSVSLLVRRPGADAKELRVLARLERLEVQPQRH